MFCIALSLEIALERDVFLNDDERSIPSPNLYKRSRYQPSDRARGIRSRRHCATDTLGVHRSSPAIEFESAGDGDIDQTCRGPVRLVGGHQNHSQCDDPIIVVRAQRRCGVVDPRGLRRAQRPPPAERPRERHAAARILRRPRFGRER